MKYVISVICALMVIATVAVGAEKNTKPAGMEEKAFTILPTFLDRIGSLSGESLSGGFAEFPDVPVDVSDEDEIRKDLFRRMGVRWPEGSSLRYISSIGRLHAVNTPENLRKLEAALALIDVVPSQLEIEVQYVAFSKKDINKLASVGMVDQGALEKLWLDGKAELIGSPKVVTQSGSEATVKAVAEYIYPTEFTATTERETSSNTAVRVSVSGGVVEPGSFETREVGDLLTALPEVSADSEMIFLTLTPELVLPPVWKDYGQKVKGKDGTLTETPMLQPFFYSYNTVTTVTEYNNKRILISGGKPSREGDKVVYTFVTTRLINPEGTPLDLKPIDEPTKDDKGMITANYSILPTFINRIGPLSNECLCHKSTEIHPETAEESIDEQLKRFFAELGVQWSEGSSISYIGTIGRLFITNTPENIAKLETVISMCSCCGPSQVEMEVQFVEYDKKDIDKLAVLGIVEQKDLEGLWQAGKAELIAAPKVITQSGSEATVKAVEEYIYPTEFLATSLDPAGTTIDTVVEPDSFETREVGVLLTVLPEVSADSQMINLTLTPEVVLPPVWKDYGQKVTDKKGKVTNVSMPQPFFYSYSNVTTVNVYNNKRVLTAGGKPSRNKGKVVYTFVVARLVDPSGKPLEVR